MIVFTTVTYFITQCVLKLSTSEKRAVKGIQQPGKRYMLFGFLAALTVSSQQFLPSACADENSGRGSP